MTQTYLFPFQQTSAWDSLNVHPDSVLARTSCVMGIPSVLIIPTRTAADDDLDMAYPHGLWQY